MKILLNISGGIAAYKTPELIRHFQKQGHEVRVARTSNAQKFVTDLVLETLTGNKIMGSSLDLMEDAQSSGPIDHIALARWADVYLYAPATASALAKLAQGLADDAPTVLALAFEGPMVICPAMNQAMWKSPQVQNNCQTLQDFGYQVVEPEEGELACGEIGAGRLASFDKISSALASKSKIEVDKSPWKNKKVVITAGPTRAFLDPIRFISNSSTGKMGVSIATKLKEQGAQVTLVHGPLEHSTPLGVKSFYAETSEEMNQKTLNAFKDADCLIATAAVGDFIPVETKPSKIKKEPLKQNDVYHMEFKQGPDILMNCAQSKETHQKIVGFAAETDHLNEKATEKLKRKNCDLLIGNLVGRDKGFGDQSSELVLFSPDHKPLSLGSGDKDLMAQKLIDTMGDELFGEAPL